MHPGGLCCARWVAVAAAAAGKEGAHVRLVEAPVSRHLHRDSSPSGAGRGCVSLEELLMADTGPGPAGSFRPM